MKIYNVVKVPQGLGYDDVDYEALYQSGYTAGYENGWADAEYECRQHRNYSKEYFTIEMLGDGTISPYYYPGKTLQYRKNGGDWITYRNIEFSVNTGDIVEFRGNLTSSNPKPGHPPAGLFYRGIDGSCIVYGNILSLSFLDDFKDKTDIFNYGQFLRGCSGLVDASNLVLPATSLTESCYWAMFQDCSSLIAVPKLPITTLASTCYSEMFRGCTSLTTAPELPATVWEEKCYDKMFLGCTNLIITPSAIGDSTTIVPKSACTEMFYGCTSLTTAPELPATTVTEYCYYHMFSGCTNLTEAPSILPATTLARGSYVGMFGGCTSLTTAPELPATSLAVDCYLVMFQFCTSLTTAPALPATTLAAGCYHQMFFGCTSLTTAPELPATILADSCYGYMFYGCTNLNYIKCLATNISANSCTYNWVNGVSSTGTFVKNANMSSWRRGESGIPNNWTIETV